MMFSFRMSLGLGHLKWVGGYLISVLFIWFIFDLFIFSCCFVLRSHLCMDWMVDFPYWVAMCLLYVKHRQCDVCKSTRPTKLLMGDS